MNEQELIKPVTDPAEVARAMSLIEDVVDKPWHLKLEWLKEHRWAAVPVESASHFFEREAEWISEAARSIGCYECLAVITEAMESTVLCYRVLTTQEGLLEFSWECHFFNYVLIPRDRSFAILCTKEDYFIVAGRKEFVTKAVGTSIPTARKMFLRFGDDPSWPNPERKHFIAVAEKYKHFDGR